ncbi:hypothetical protein EVAR_94994_1 [Eumeta japonica]|uniref:Uncharacterized protein n=1 Tax=Eumeta variegata TaxID=151549 RepID=A0A4C1UV25_EUMVA|nr:hypothetical protein EVAR_94994_1 [Eumeta japonica]
MTGKPLKYAAADRRRGGGVAADAGPSAARRPPPAARRSVPLKQKYLENDARRNRCESVLRSGRDRGPTTAPVDNVESPTRNLILSSTDYGSDNFRKLTVEMI